jgi:hypothetical protein
LKYEHIEDITRFKKGYQPGTILIKDENCADFHNIVNSSKNYFCHLLNVYGVNGVRQTEICIADLVLLKLNAVEKLKRYKSPGTDQIPAELIQAKHVLRSINLLILFGIMNNCHNNGEIYYCTYL